MEGPPLQDSFSIEQQEEVVRREANPFRMKPRKLPGQEQKVWAPEPGPQSLPRSSVSREQSELVAIEPKHEFERIELNKSSRTSMEQTRDIGERKRRLKVFDFNREEAKSIKSESIKEMLPIPEEEAGQRRGAILSELRQVLEAPCQHEHVHRVAHVVREKEVFVSVNHLQDLHQASRLRTIESSVEQLRQHDYQQLVGKGRMGAEFALHRRSDDPGLNSLERTNSKYWGLRKEEPRVEPPLQPSKHAPAGQEHLEYVFYKNMDCGNCPLCAETTSGASRELTCEVCGNRMERHCEDCEVGYCRACERA